FCSYFLFDNISIFTFMAIILIITVGFTLFIVIIKSKDSTSPNKSPVVYNMQTIRHRKNNL
ncbi:MAG: hypothetical protein ACK5LC_09885, partial [Coprobacillaceae bacterium]